MITQHTRTIIELKYNDTTGEYDSITKDIIYYYDSVNMESY